ncbi:hypothetical protein ES288_A07G121900v1 [Gossypium darwinii]|uniref:Uncharacterized protein n=1 Tax=Gossypium darwinii TaxID=34276 RepID=A0A5D2FVP3_GOSDA|nr:hypothetical protein ES288_A07G121900v1 [Gossypium darwinii]
MSFNFQVIKVFHPESSIANKESKRLQRQKTNNTPYSEHEYTDGDQISQHKDNRCVPLGLKSMEGTEVYKTISKPPQYEFACWVYWIKTDVDWIKIAVG